MEKQKLIEIQNSITMLPVLQKRLQKLGLRIAEAENDMQTILQQYNAEVLDVEQMKKDSLSNTLLRFMKKYEGKFDKETQEMLAAKMEYDKASDRVMDLYSEREELNKRISLLLDNKQAYEEELKKREEIIKKSITSKAYLIYHKLQEKRETYAQQLVEINEAIGVAQHVQSTVYSAAEHLGSAEDWATYDIWARGGILSHMIKYDHIDNAQADFNRLSYQIKDLKKELADTRLFEMTNSIGIDSTTRIFDFWFDNIFTDLNVRDKIRADKEEVSKLSTEITSIIARLQEARAEVIHELEVIEDNKKELLVNNN